MNDKLPPTIIRKMAALNIALPMSGDFVEGGGCFNKSASVPNSPITALMMISPASSQTSVSSGICSMDSDDGIEKTPETTSTATTVEKQQQQMLNKRKTIANIQISATNNKDYTNDDKSSVKSSVVEGEMLPPQAKSYDLFKDFQYAQLPECNLEMFLNNRSQYNRLSPLGHIQEFRLVSCKCCNFLIPEQPEIVPIAEKNGLVNAIIEGAKRVVNFNAQIYQQQEQQLQFQQQQQQQQEHQRQQMYYQQMQSQYQQYYQQQKGGQTSNYNRQYNNYNNNNNVNRHFNNSHHFNNNNGGAFGPKVGKHNQYGYRGAAATQYSYNNNNNANYNQFLGGVNGFGGRKTALY